MSFTGVQIKQIRISLDLNINDFAKKIGVSGRTVKYWEDDEKVASAKHVRAIKDLVSSSKVHEDSAATLMLRVHNLLLNIEARERANASMLKRIYSISSQKKAKDVDQEYDKELKRFLYGGLEDQQLTDSE